MKQGIYKILKNTPLTKNVYKMTLEGDTSAITRPGQFINIKIDSLFLRRPISVFDYDSNTITVIYKVAGIGTEKMSRMLCGDALDVLTGLGNGYDTSKSGETPLLVGGGVGVQPLYNLCKKLVSENKKPIVVLGFNTADEVFCKEDFAKAGAKVYLATADGTCGEKGFVTDIIKNLQYTYFYSCGPEAMFKAMEKVVKTSGQYSFEERMGCGFGACMGCSCKTKYKNKRICKDGPVLEREEIIW